MQALPATPSSASGSKFEIKKNKGRELLEKEGLQFYERGGTIGEGAYSKVKLAYSTRLQRDIAVKIINRAKSSTEFRIKFLPRELRLVKVLHHANIVNFRAVFDLTDRVYILMDVARGGDLLAYVQKNQYVVESCARPLFQKVCEAVAYLHSRNVVHRDLKCENILLTHDFQPKLTDFGFARYCSSHKDTQDPHSSSSSSKKPASAAMRALCGTFCGSPAYASVEIRLGRPYDGALADAFALGCVLYICVTGVMPFDDKNIKTHVTQMRQGPRFHDSKQKLSIALRVIITRILDPCVDTRPDAQQILDDMWFRSMSSADERTVRTVESEKRINDSQPLVNVHTLVTALPQAEHRVHT